MLRPGWLVVLFAAVVAMSAWLPWRTTVGGQISAIGWPWPQGSAPSKFDSGQLILLLASTLMVAGAMTARGLSSRLSAVAALVLSLSIGGLTMAYYSQKVHPPFDAAYGLYIGAAGAVAAGICSLWALLAALMSRQRAR